MLLLEEGHLSSETTSADGGGAGTSSSNWAHKTPPKSFKAVKRRKSLNYIEAGYADDVYQGEIIEPTRRPSGVNPDLIDGTEAGTVTAGIARLIYRYLDEGSDARAQGAPDNRGQMFNEDQFFRPHRSLLFRCFCCRRRRLQPDTSDGIFELLQSIARTGRFSKDLLVLCAIYMERLLREPSIFLSPDNWQPILVTGILLASKVWEDIHPWNIDYASILRNAVGLEFITVISMYELESLFLECIEWNVCVSGEEFGQYLFALRDTDTSAPNSPLAASPHSASAGQRVASSSLDFGLGLRTPLSSDMDCVTSAMTTEAPLPSATMLSFSPRDLEASYAPFEDSEPLGELPPSRLPCKRASIASLRHSGSEVFGRSGSGPLGEVEALGMGRKMMLDRRNPHVGSFRHAPPAEPPSRHIGEKKPRLKVSMSCASLASLASMGEGEEP